MMAITATPHSLCAILAQICIKTGQVVAANHAVALRALAGLLAFPSALAGRIVGVYASGAVAWTPN